MDVGDIINQYLEEANLDTDLDRLEVITTQERLVNNKHKWSARLINHKINVSNFKFKRESALEDRITEFQNTEPVRVSRTIAERAVRNKKEIKEVGDIIKMFRQHSRPTWVGGKTLGKSFMNYPQEFHIKFLTDT